MTTQELQSALETLRLENRHLDNNLSFYADTTQSLALDIATLNGEIAELKKQL